MNAIFSVLAQSPLFDGIDPNDYQKVLDCIEFYISDYKKNDIILFTGDPIKHIGLIVSGNVRILKEDYGGNTLILSELSAPDLFGEVFACGSIQQSPVTVQAAQPCKIIFLNYAKIIHTCSNVCHFHEQLIKNMLRILAQKNLMLNGKIEILSKRTTREKILCFLEMYRKEEQPFAIPYTREEMAQMLCVDRSALSSELSRMQRDGILCYHRNEFEI